MQISDTLAKPTCQAAVWLITQPEPSALDERLARPRIAGPAYPAIAIHPTALERCWGKAEITGDLPAVLERTIEHFARQNGGEIVADAAELTQSLGLSCPNHRAAEPRIITLAVVRGDTLPQSLAS